jgi:hypothetical protein
MAHVGVSKLLLIGIVSKHACANMRWQGMKRVQKLRLTSGKRRGGNCRLMQKGGAGRLGGAKRNKETVVFSKS